jgi:hypothetical protein
VCSVCHVDCIYLRRRHTDAYNNEKQRIIYKNLSQKTKKPHKSDCYLHHEQPNRRVQRWRRYHDQPLYPYLKSTTRFVSTEDEKTNMSTILSQFTWSSNMCCFVTRFILWRRTIRYTIDQKQKQKSKLLLLPFDAQ